ncbi:MAG: RDD family protein [Candidatus Pristimantibacillus sp.]
MEGPQYPQYPPAPPYRPYPPVAPRTKMGELTVTYSSSNFFKRWAATIIDFILFLGFIGFLLFTLYDTKINLGIPILAVLFLTPAYYIFLEGYTGFTLGKFIMRIQTVNADGESPGLVKALIRTALRLVDVNPFLAGGLPAGICVLVTKEKQRLGDMAAKTYVVNSRDLDPPSPERKTTLTVIFTLLGLFAVVFVILGIVTLNTKGFGESSSTGEKNEESKVFVSKDGNFQLTTPSDWRKDDSLNDEADISASNWFKEKYAIVLSENKADFESGYTLEEYEETIESNFIDGLSDSPIYEPYPTMINGNPAYRFVVEEQSDGIAVVYSIAVIETPTHFHQLVTWTEERKYDRYEEELDGVIASFKESES